MREILGHPASAAIIGTGVGIVAESLAERIIDVPQQQVVSQLDGDGQLLLQSKPTIKDELTIQYANAVRKGLISVNSQLTEEQRIRANPIFEAVMDPFPHDPNHFKGMGYKRLGMISIGISTWQGDHLVDGNSGFELAPGANLIEVHLPPVSQKDKSFSNITDSFRLLADFMYSQNLFPDYIVGFTYERLASAARRAGFNLSIIELPEVMRELVEKEFEILIKLGHVSGEMGEPTLVYQSTEDFLRRFGPSNRKYLNSLSDLVNEGDSNSL